MVEESQLAKFLSESGGNVSAAAIAAGISRRQLHRRIEESLQLQELLVDLRETVGDSAEGCIRKAIEGGDVKTSMWYLLSSAIGRARGYAKSGDRSLTEGNTPLTQLVEVVVSSPEEVKAMMDFEEFLELAAGSTLKTKLGDSDVG